MIDQVLKYFLFFSSRWSDSEEHEDTADTCKKWF